MKLASFVLMLVLCAAVAFATARYTVTASKSIDARETAFDRVLRSGEIRCGYGVYAPYFTKDPATGEFGGIWHDLTEAIGTHLGLKIVWSDEVGLGDVGVALESGKIDAFCGGLWTAGKRVRTVDFLKPSAYEPVLVYVRTDDHRFDDDLAKINDPSIRVSTIDGEGGGLVASEEFPKATMVSLTQLSSYADMYNQVVTGKADVLLSAPSGAAVFVHNNPGVLRAIVSKPVRVFPAALAIRYGEDRLRDMLNQAQDDIIYNGEMDKIITRGEVNKGDFWRVGKPYETSQEK